jgi:hypothetical protein
MNGINRRTCLKHAAAAGTLIVPGIAVAATNQNKIERKAYLIEEGGVGAEGLSGVPSKRKRIRAGICHKLKVSRGEWLPGRRGNTVNI